MSFVIHWKQKYCEFKSSKFNHNLKGITMTVTVDHGRDALLTTMAKEILTDRYTLPGETYQDMFARVAAAFADDYKHAQRLYDYMSKHWFMPATPILSNGGAGRGMPISCFLNTISDSLEGIQAGWNENMWLAAKGGGIGTYWGHVRSVAERVGKVGSTSGVIPFIKVMDSQTLAISQGSLRRGSAAVYMQVSHPEIEEFIEMRRPTGGDVNRKCLNLHNAVVIPDKFMIAVENDENWDLISPKTNEVVSTVRARDLWIRILTARIETGEPYLLFIDAVNKAIPDHHKLAGLEVETSNLCVSGDTLVTTRNGDFPIKDLVGKDVEVWNGLEWSLVTPKITSPANEVYPIHISVKNLATNSYEDQITLRATSEHMFYLGDSINPVPARVLRKGDVLQRWNSPHGNDFTNLEFIVAEDFSFDTFVVEPTYCFTEPLRHRGMFNGIVTGQCNEITLHTSPTRTAVCCLSSLNLETYSEWEGNVEFLDDVLRFLDNVLQYFIENAPDTMAKAKYSAMRERSVGLGVMGFHSFLQQNGVPIESVMAKVHNRRIFAWIKKTADEVSVKLAHEKGACPDAEEHGIMERFSNKIAIAPTANISVICGESSPGIEPYAANAFLQKTLSGSFLVKNKYLEKLLAKYEKNDTETWKSIVLNEGSVQHLDFLTDDERDTFKTAFEIDQRWLIELAADRVQYICQSQSFNIFLPADISKKALNQLHLYAWKRGLKGMYYCRSKSIARAEKSLDHSGKYDMMDNINQEECLSCQ